MSHRQLGWVTTGAFPTTLGTTLQSTWGETWTIIGARIAGPRDDPAPIAVVAQAPVQEWYDYSAIQRFLLLDIGAGDLLLGRPPAIVLRDLAMYCLDRRTQGWLALVCTVLPREDWSGLPAQAEMARTRFEQARVAYNDALLTASVADAVLNLTALQDVSRYFVPASGTLNADGVYYACQQLREAVDDLILASLQTARRRSRASNRY